MFIERFHKRAILEQLATLYLLGRSHCRRYFIQLASHTCNCSSIWLTDRSPGRTLAAANAENRKQPAASARPVRREGKNREAIGEGCWKEDNNKPQFSELGRALPIKRAAYRRLGPPWTLPSLLAATTHLRHLFVFFFVPSCLSQSQVDFV